MTQACYMLLFLCDVAIIDVVVVILVLSLLLLLV